MQTFSGIKELVFRAPNSSGETTWIKENPDSLDGNGVVSAKTYQDSPEDLTFLMESLESLEPYWDNSLVAIVKSQCSFFYCFSGGKKEQ